MGAVLLTDAKGNLGQLFEVGQEVVAYDSAADCVAKIKHLEAHPDEMANLARAGQARTHSYRSRVQEMVGALESL